jgi:hypothetical protein
MFAKLVEYIKTNPFVNLIIFGVVFAGSVIGFDERYAHADSLNNKLEINRLTSEVSTLSTQKSMLEYKVDDKLVKPKLSAQEQAILERYKNELADVNGKIRSKQNLIDKLQAGK